MTPAGAQPLQSGSQWWRHLPLAWPLAKRDVLARYRGSFAGVLWALAAPLGMVLVYALVFQGVFKAPWAGREVGGLGYAMRLFAGLMVFSAVAEVAGRASRLIQDNANLVKRVVFPLELLSVSLVLQVSIHLLLQVLVLAALLIITGEGPHWRWLAWPVVLLWTLLLQVALAWLLTALGAYVRDLQHLVPVLFSGLLFMSPVFYPTHGTRRAAGGAGGEPAVAAHRPGAPHLVWRPAQRRPAGCTGWRPGAGPAAGGQRVPPLAPGFCGSGVNPVGTSSGEPAQAGAMNAPSQADGSVIELIGVSKRYSLENRPWARLWEQLRNAGHGGTAQAGRSHHALHDVHLQLRRGEVLGVVGRNGAGKSTLLQVVAGVLEPSAGVRRVQGRVAALLELGAGFSPDLTGRENVRFNGPLLGLSGRELEARLPQIVDFAGIGEFIDQPVRSYSSGMFVRLAFAMATSVEPDILVIDEALSVGDGAFARKSFDRIMSLKDRGVTILFCSHSTYHVEAICSRVLWLDQGRVCMLDDAARVVAAYNDYIGGEGHGFEPRETHLDAVATLQTEEAQADAADAAGVDAMPFRAGHGRLLRLNARTASHSGRRLRLHTLQDDVSIEVDYVVDPELPPPSLIVSLFTRGGTLVASAGSHNDGVTLPRDASVQGRACITLRQLPLLKGDYFINVFLACERGLHYYESALYAIDSHARWAGTRCGDAATGVDR
jgi:lipopolysaccharide transport system ATP-binding protein